MLLPSILTILDQDRRPLDGAAPPGALAPADSAGPAEAAEGLAQGRGIAPAGPFVEELLRAITKLEQSDESRVLDMFE